MAGFSHGQVVLSAPPSGAGGGGGSGGLSVTASPVSMPLGHKVTLTLSGQAEGDEINWVRLCPIDNQPTLDVTDGECDCSGAGDDIIGFPRVPSIFDSPINPGTYVYEARIGSSKAGATVTVHPPNEATTTIGPNELFMFPTAGNPSWHKQTMETILKYNGVSLGKCAKVCCSEKVEVVVVKEHARHLGGIRFSIPNWSPNPCFTTSHFGNSKRPTEWTMKWESPKMFDKNWQGWTLDGFKYIQTLPSNTVIATRVHEYRFTGKKCDNSDWGPLETKVELELIVRPARNQDGTPVQPTRNIPQWRIK